jgi:hypothetical protein
MFLLLKTIEPQQAEGTKICSVSYKLPNMSMQAPFSYWLSKMVSSIFYATSRGLSILFNP